MGASKGFGLSNEEDEVVDNWGGGTATGEERSVTVPQSSALDMLTLRC